MPVNKDFCKSVLDNLSEGVYFVDRERMISYWNKGAERITGYRSGEVVGSFCRDNILNHVDGQGVELCLELCPLAKTILDGTNQEAEIYLKHKDGHRVPVFVRGVPLRNSKGAIVGAVEIFRDISAKNRLTQRLEELRKIALLDPLTGMGNRRFVETGLSSRLNELQRYGWKFGLLFIDIDHFKKVNDSYGHETGDMVLKMVAGTLVHNARSFDLIGRWGGEEFVAIVVNVTGEELFSIAQKYRILVEESSLMSGKDKISVTISTGATLARPDDSPETLLKRADQLMYQSKLSGRNCVITDS
ncbi:MAG: sensor domain-containing diguanylate cyclase [Candidatus Omnitrophota bacterium]